MIKISDFTNTKIKIYYMYDNYVTLVSNINTMIDEYFDYTSSKIKDPDWEPPVSFWEEIKLFKKLYKCEKKIVLTDPEKNINEFFELYIDGIKYYNIPLFVKLDSDSSIFNDYENIKFVLYRKVFCTENQYAKVKLVS